MFVGYLKMYLVYFKFDCASDNICSCVRRILPAVRNSKCMECLALAGEFYLLGRGWKTLQEETRCSRDGSEICVEKKLH
jgi:hypothetical protein